MNRMGARKSLRMVLAVLLGCWLPSVACSQEVGRVDAEVLARVTSPDSVVDAVLTRASADATTPYVYRVHLVARGARVPSEPEREVFRADRADSVAVQWVGPGQLEVAYRRARIFHFTNFWNDRSVRDFRYTVEIRLKPLSAQPALAPPER